MSLVTMTPTKFRADSRRLLRWESTVLVLAHLRFEQWPGGSIPRGLRPSAQGCPDFSGLPWVHIRKWKQRQRRCGQDDGPTVAEWPQPCCGWKWLGTMTQGGSFLATLGFETESRRDSWTAHSTLQATGMRPVPVYRTACRLHQKHYHPRR